MRKFQNLHEKWVKFFDNIWFPLKTRVKKMIKLWVVAYFQRTQYFEILILCFKNTVTPTLPQKGINKKTNFPLSYSPQKSHEQYQYRNMVP